VPTALNPAISLLSGTRDYPALKSNIFWRSAALISCSASAVVRESRGAVGRSLRGPYDLCTAPGQRSLNEQGTNHKLGKKPT